MTMGLSVETISWFYFLFCISVLEDFSRSCQILDLNSSIFVDTRLTWIRIIYNI